MDEQQVKCFAILSDNFDEELELPNGVTFGFEYNEKMYFIMNQVSLLSSKVLEDDDADLEEEYKRVSSQMRNTSKSLELIGFKSISLIDYKSAEQEMKTSKQNNFMSGFSDTEKIVYDETRNFMKEYDITLPVQRHFLSSLRTVISQGDFINELYLEVHAQNSKKDLEDIFDSGMQSVVCDFISELQKKLISHPTKSKKKNKTV